MCCWSEHGVMQMKIIMSILYGWLKDLNGFLFQRSSLCKIPKILLFRPDCLSVHENWIETCLHLWELVEFQESANGLNNIEVGKQIPSVLLFRPITLYVSELCSFCHLGLLLTDMQFLYSCRWLLEVCWRYIQRFLTFSHPIYKQIGQQCLLLTSYSWEKKLPFKSSAALQIGKGWGEICHKFQIYFVKGLKHDESNVATLSRS